jgi:hypothetical protein
MINPAITAARVWRNLQTPGEVEIGELKLKFLNFLVTYYDHPIALDLLLRIQAIDEKLKGPAMYEIQGNILVGSNGEEYGPLDLLRLEGASKEAMMGLSWSSIKKSAKKKYKKIPWKKVAKVTRTVGPVIATVYPPAAPAVAAAMILTEAAAKGDIKAVATEKNIKMLAENGVPAAEEAYGAIQTAKSLQRNLKAEATLVAAKYGSKGALKQLSAVKNLAKEGNPAAVEAMKIYKDASKGIKIKPEIRKKAAKKKALAKKSITRGRFLSKHVPSYVHRGGEKVEVLSSYQAGL